MIMAYNIFAMIEACITLSEISSSFKIHKEVILTNPMGYKLDSFSKKIRGLKRGEDIEGESGEFQKDFSSLQ